MKKFGVVLGVAAVATLAGCKSPEYARRNAPARNTDKAVAVENAKPAPVVTVKSCTCAPGTTHTSPCKCGASDCRCIVVAPVQKPAPAPVEAESTVYIVQRGDYLAKISKRYNVTIAAIRKLNPSIKKDIVRIGQKIKLPGKVDVGVQRAPAPVAAKKKAAKPFAPYTGATRQYVVKSGDSLGAIAYGNGITIRQLKELNSLKSDRIVIGQKLKIPAAKAVAQVKKPAEEKKAPPPAPEKVEPKVEAAPAPQSAVESAVVSTSGSTLTEEKDDAEAPAAPQSAAADSAAAPKNDGAVANETYVVQEGDDMTGVSIRWGVSAAAIRELNNLGDNDQLKPGQIIKLPAEAQQ